MTFEDDLQRSFDSAGSGVDLQPGSVSTVKRRAARRTRNARLVAGTAAVLVVLTAGRLISLPETDTVEIATGGGTDTTIAADAAAAEDSADVEDPAEVDTADASDTTATTQQGSDSTLTIEAGDSSEQSDDSQSTTTSERLTEADFTYLGAFTTPSGRFGQSTFEYGGQAATFNPFGDPANTDSFGGSLFMAGHPVDNLGVAEITIPEPEQHFGDTAGLPAATVLQPFADITAGRGSEFVAGQTEYRYGGLEVVEQDGQARLHWTLWQVGNVSQNVVPGHGHSSLDLANPDPQGPWFLGDYPNLQTSGYLTAVPSAFADQYLGGRSLLTGHLVSDVGATGSGGPPFFAYQPPAAEQANATVDALELALYPIGQPLAGYGAGDATAGAAWVSTTAGGEAIVAVGRRGLGEVRNGEPRDGDCSPYAGVHADPYEPQVFFYDPADLAAVAEGRLQPDQIEPYRKWNPVEHLIPNCAGFLSSISFDPESDRAYVVQIVSDVAEDFSLFPVVHVFQL